MSVVEVDDHAGATGVSVGVKICAGHCFADVDVDGAHPVTRSLGELGGEPDRGGFGVGEEHLRHGVNVRGGDVRAPWCAVHGVTGCRGGDRGAGNAGLVFALVCQQCPVVDIAQRIEPVVVNTGDATRVVDFEPRPGPQANSVQADVAAVGCAASRENHLVDFQFALVEDYRHRSRAARSTQLNHRAAGTNV